MKNLLLLFAILLSASLQASSGDDLSGSDFDEQGTYPGPAHPWGQGSSDEESDPFSDEENQEPKPDSLSKQIFAHWPHHESRLPYDGVYVEDTGLEGEAPTYAMIGTPQQQTELIKMAFAVKANTLRQQHVVIKKPDRQKASLTFTWEPQMPYTWAFSIQCQEALQVLREDQSSYEKDNALMIHYDPELLRFVFDGEERLPKIHLGWAGGDDKPSLTQEIGLEIYPLTLSQ